MEKSEMMKLLDASTIAILLKIYGLKYKHVGLRLRCSRQNVGYLLKFDNFSPYQREIILELLLQHGLEASELVLVHHMTKKVKQL